MAYRVEVTARAARDLRRIYRDIEADHSVQAADWFNGLESLVLSLEEHPSRGSSVPEDRNLRQVLHGNKPYVYRVIYAIDEPGLAVRVLHIRHGARQNFGPAGPQ
jgi:plasmid stabilization system protein ParE